MTEDTKLAPGLQTLSLSLLHESPENPREISDERFEALRYSLRTDPDMMLARPLIADEDGMVVCGNMRLRGMVAEEWTEGPVFVKTDWKPGQKREWMLRDNQGYGDYVPEQLAAMVAAHADEGHDMKLLGLSDQRTDNLLKMARSEDEQNGGSGGSNGETPPDLFAVVVECEDGDQQAQLIEQLTDQGYDCRALLS